jgi:hypothetical protein
MYDRNQIYRQKKSKRLLFGTIVPSKVDVTRYTRLVVTPITRLANHHLHSCNLKLYTP